MKRDPLAELSRRPELRALTSAYAALRPLSPEGRRKVIEALHALLEVSPGSRVRGERGQDKA